ncbi:MAG TPA: DUF6600 domain-containing protein [Candidatus Acidoferrales bacterium]|jgi:hypothetical protein|nr:DUF6600 domain-containing protein [Candidatus Acidoferrales bacterium]
MNQIKLLAGRLGIALCCALPGYLSRAQPSVEVGVSVPVVVAPTVEIRVESDFYEPLAPQGEWVVIGSYGRCWRPAHVARDWRPYCNGNWERTDAGWYWQSDEPWAWATYHYGRWNCSEDGGWYWVPQVQWAPAWVSWHSGGGYIGWVPLQPAGVTVILPQAYVFVGEADFMKPVRSSTVIVNNTTIIKQTVIIQQGPTTAVIEKASGHKIAAVPVQELRHKTEAAVVIKQQHPAATTVEKKAQPPVRSEAQPVEKKAVAPREPAQVEKSAAAHESAAPAPQERKSVPVPAESKPEVKPEGNSRPPIAEPSQPKAEKRSVENPSQPAVRNVQPPARETPAASEKGGASPDDKGNGQGKKDKE